MVVSLSSGRGRPQRNFHSRTAGTYFDSIFPSARVGPSRGVYRLRTITIIIILLFGTRCKLLSGVSNPDGTVFFYFFFLHSVLLFIYYYLIRHNRSGPPPPPFGVATGTFSKRACARNSCAVDNTYAGTTYVTECVARAFLRLFFVFIIILVVYTHVNVLYCSIRRARGKNRVINLSARRAKARTRRQRSNVPVRNHGVEYNILRDREKKKNRFSADFRSQSWKRSRAAYQVQPSRRTVITFVIALVRTLIDPCSTGNPRTEYSRVRENSG